MQTDLGSVYDPELWVLMERMRLCMQISFSEGCLSLGQALDMLERLFLLAGLGTIEL